ncbi:MAG: amidohydrolase [Planctomycetota bacterium]|nr:MAG: amidohydrolase [Planctomycetota bacterium]
MANGCPNRDEALHSTQPPTQRRVAKAHNPQQKRVRFTDETKKSGPAPSATALRHPAGGSGTSAPFRREIPLASFDLLIENARLFCPLGLPPEHDAIGVRAGRIVATGRGELLRDGAGARTRRLDVGGRRVTPGLHDAHLHLTDGGLSLLQLDARTDDLETLLARVRERARTLPPGAWIVGRGWDEGRLRQRRAPTLDELDHAGDGHPVLLRRVCGHMAVANRQALQRAGFDTASPDPPGGRIGRTAQGELDGRLFETAVDRVLERVPPPGRDERLLGLRLALAEARRHGLTSVEDERGDPALYAALAERGELTARVRIWHPIDAPLEELVAWRESFPDDPRIRPGLLKGYLDGSLGARTAWFHEPYADAPESCGMPVLDPERLARLLPERHAAGFQVGLHAIGDRAVRLALEQFAALPVPSPPPRHRLEHAQHVRLEDLRLVQRGRTVASMQPSHLGTDVAIVERRLGRGRLAGAYAWRSWLEAGAIVCFGSDFPIEPMDPRTSLHAACTRRPRTGGAPLPPEREAVTPAQAFTAFTLGSARAAHREHELGSLQPGRWADLVVWEDDPFETPAERWLTLRIHAVRLAGEPVGPNRCTS